MKKGILISISVIIQFCLSCSSHEKCDYKYFEGLSFYLNEKFDFQINDFEENSILYIFPVNACEPCVKHNMSILRETKSNVNLHLILVGESDPVYEEDVNAFYRKFIVYRDLDQEIHNYETGLGKPLVIWIESGICVKYREVSDNMILKR
jgi:hypothetical protein